MERSIVTLMQSACRCGLSWTRLMSHLKHNGGTASLVKRQLHSQCQNKLLTCLPATKLLPNNTTMQSQRKNMVTKSFNSKINHSVSFIQKNKFHDSKIINSSQMGDDKTQYVNANNDLIEDTQNITKDNTVVSDDIEDVEEYIETEDIEPAWVPPISLKRSKKGVFEIDELVTLLREGKAYDICVLEIPKHLNFVDHMVIVSAFSSRHMLALTNNVKFVYKKRKNKEDSHFKVEGLDTNNWYAMDMGNIMLHIFMPETREIYDIETLWTVGEEFDSRKSEEMMDAYGLSESDMMLLRLGLEVNTDSGDLHSDEMGLDNRP